MLDLSKIEAGQLMLALDDYSLKDVVHDASYGAVEPLAADKKLDLQGRDGARTCRPATATSAA